MPSWTISYMVMATQEILGNGKVLEHFILQESSAGLKKLWTWATVTKPKKEFDRVRERIDGDE